MGFFDFFLKPKTQPYQKIVPSADAVKALEEFQESNNRTAIQRDYGMQSKNVREALEVLHEAAPTLPGLSLFLDQNGFRSMNRSIRDMNEAARQNLLVRCETVSVVNALASRFMTIRTDLIVSEGFRCESTAKNKKNKERVQEVIDSHWGYNIWDEELFNRVQDLGVCGELIRRMPPVSRKIGKVDPEIFNPGMFRCGLVLPHLVRGCSLTPWNYEVLDKLYLQDYTYEKMNLLETNNKIELKIVTDESINIKDFGSVKGEVFYTSVNRRPGTTRGLSDIAPVIDWIDLHDKAFMSDVERAEMMKRFIWDVTLEGAGPKQIEEYARKLKVGGPSASSVRIHNQKETWDAVAPDLKVGELGEMRQQLFLHIWGGMGLPRHWYVEAENVNRASSDNMTDPTMAWARTRKRLVSRMLELECKMAVQVAYESGRLSDIPTDELGIRIVSRDPDRKGYEGVGAVWRDMADSLTLLQNQGMVDKKSAANIVRVVLGAYGFEIDPALLEEENAMKEKQAMLAQQQQQQDENQPPQENSPKSGIMGSENPLDAVINEAFPMLERAKKEGKDLLRRF